MALTSSQTALIVGSPAVLVATAVGQTRIYLKPDGPIEIGDSGLIAGSGYTVAATPFDLMLQDGDEIWAVAPSVNCSVTVLAVN